MTPQEFKALQPGDRVKIVYPLAMNRGKLATVIRRQPNGSGVDVDVDGVGLDGYGVASSLELVSKAQQPAPLPAFKVGDRVIHTQQPGWGVGKVTIVHNPVDIECNFATGPACWICDVTLLQAAPAQQQPTQQAQQPSFQVGDRVTHKNRPDLGEGIVIKPDVYGTTKVDFPAEKDFPAFTYLLDLVAPAQVKPQAPQQQAYGLMSILPLRASFIPSAPASRPAPSGAACSHCGEWNEYQTGPFRCYSCRVNPYRPACAR